MKLRFVYKLFVVVFAAGALATQTGCPLDQVVDRVVAAHDENQAPAEPSLPTQICELITGNPDCDRD